MELPEEIKRIRQRSLLTQIDFAKEVKVAFSTVNRWECGKAKPNINAMKSITLTDILISNRKQEICSLQNILILLQAYLLERLKIEIKINQNL